MSAIPQGFASLGTALYPQFGNGVYVGKNPGSSNTIPVGGYGGANSVATNAITLQTDTGFVSSIAGVPVNNPTNVLRMYGGGGVGFIQASNIAFTMPYSGNVGVRILPSTNQINVQQLAFVSTINAIGTGGTGVAGAINMTELTSSIKGYGWASVMPSSP